MFGRTTQLRTERGTKHAEMLKCNYNQSFFFFFLKNHACWRFKIIPERFVPLKSVLCQLNISLVNRQKRCLTSVMGAKRRRTVR